MWTSYELEEFGTYAEYTLDDLAAIYEFEVNKREYPDFGGWLWDMERSAVLYRHE